MKDATTDEATIIRWWTHWPDCNIGITGNSIFALDFDPRNGTLDSPVQLEREYGEFPTLATVTTSQGNTGKRDRHVYIKQPADVVGCPKNHGMGAGVDVKGVGGYLMAHRACTNLACGTKGGK